MAFGRRASRHSSAMGGLGRLEGQAAVKPLSRVLQMDQEPALRQAAALYLGRISGKAARRALAQAKNDRDPSVRQAVALSLDYLSKN